MTTDNVVVMTVSGAGEEASAATQESIFRELSAGRDVVVVCESHRMKRTERLLLTLPAIERLTADEPGPSGRLAIVNEAGPVRETLPAGVAHRVQFFASLEVALRWLRPQPVGPFGRTLRYITRPACPVG
jgi:hypothetical protein